MVTARRLRVVYFGTPEFAVPTLRRMLEAPSGIEGRGVMTSSRVVSQPDRPKGRGHHLAPTPTKVVALAAGIPVLQPERLQRRRVPRADRGALRPTSASSPHTGGCFPTRC